MDQPAPEQKLNTSKKPKTSLNTKKTFKQIRSRTLLTILLLFGLAVYQYIMMNRIEKGNKEFQDRLAKQIDTSDQKQLAKIDSVIRFQAQSNKSILSAQKASEDRIKNSIKKQAE